MKYAFSVSCSGGYLFGLNSAMNAMAEFGMTADWEIAYNNVDEDYRKKMSKAFPFKVNWTHINDLKAGANKVADKHWHASWLMTTAIIDKYDAICHTQADHMPLSNMTALFKAASADCFAVTEHFNTTPTLEDLYKRTTPVLSRQECSLTDQFIFTNKKYKNIFSETARLMDIKSSGDTNHPVIILNNLVKQYVPFDDIITLERHVWSFQKNLYTMRLEMHGDCIYNDRLIRLRGIHNRWWQKGKAQSEINIAEKSGRNISIGKHNWNLIRDYMAEFNAKRPEIMVENYEKTIW